MPDEDDADEAEDFVDMDDAAAEYAEPPFDGEPLLLLLLLLQLSLLLPNDRPCSKCPEVTQEPALLYHNLHCDTPQAKPPLLSLQRKVCVSGS